MPEEEKPQPDPVEPARIKEIKQNIRAGEAWLKSGNYKGKEYRAEMWKKNTAMLRCDWNDGTKLKQEETFNVNTPFANFHTVRPTMIFNSPYINVEAKKPEFERTVDETGQSVIVKDEGGRPVIKSDNYVAARLMQVRINHEIQQIRLKDVIKRCVGHSIGHYGIGWAKIGYQGLTVSNFNNDRNNKTNYWLDWCDPRSIVFDWRAVEAKRLRWIAQEHCLPRKDVEAMGLRVPPNHCGKMPEWMMEKDKQANGSESYGTEKGSQNEMVTFWEYHDLDQNTIDWVLLDGPAEEWFFMTDTSENPYPFEGSCFKPLVLTEDDEDLIGITDIQPIQDHILAINRMRTREVHHMDNYGTGVIYEDGAMTPKDRDNYSKTPYGFWLKIKQGFINKIKIAGTPSMGNDHYQMSELLKNEAMMTLGITDYQQGGSTQQRKATEAQIISSAASVRVEDKRAIISDFVIEIVRCLAAMIQEFDDEEDFYNVANEEFDDDFIEEIKKTHGYNPKVPFLGISRDKIKGEFDFSFKLEDMIMQPKEVRAAQLARSLQAVTSNELMLKKFMDMADFEKVIIDMFELNGVDIKKYEKGGPVQLTAIMENEMFRKGMEVPDPHPKDDDDEHTIAHMPLIRELEGQLGSLQGKAQQLQQGIGMIPEMMAGDPQNGQMIQQRAQQQIEMVMSTIDPIEKMLRRAKLHVQAHVLQGARKSNEEGMGGMSMGPQPGIPAQPPQQATPAQPPIGGTVV